MADITLRKPRIYQRTLQGGLMTLLGGENGLPEATNAVWVADSFVKYSTGTLTGAINSSDDIPANATTNGGTPKILGFVRDAVKSANTIDPPYTMYYNQKHFPMSLRGVRFLMNIVTISGGALQIGSAGSGPALTAVAIGTTYELAVGGKTANSGTYSGYYFLNSGGTTAPMLRVVAIPEIVAGVRQTTLASTYNGIVVCEFLDSVLESE